MSESRPDSAVLEKIKKLLALADGNQNENEREVAMQFAMEMLAKHNLTISELHGDELDIQVVEVEAEFHLHPWVRRVLDTACTLYYTDYYYSQRYNWTTGASRNFPVFVGTADNIAVTMEVATWLINSIRLESNRSYKDPALRRSFRLGAATRLRERAECLVASESATAAGSRNSLMVIRNQLQRANEDYLSTLDLEQTTMRRSTVVHSAYEAGKEFGNQVVLTRPQSGNVPPIAMIPLHSFK